MPDLAEIADFPRAFAGLVRGIGSTNRRLALADWARMRRRPVTLRQTHTVRSASLRTKVFLQKVGHEVFFFFIRRPATEEVILDLRLDFEVMPSVEDTAPESPALVNATVKLPSFLVDSPSDQERAVLAAALHEKDPAKIVFLKLGLFRMGAISPEDPGRAQVAWMLHDSARASIVYTPLAFNPDPFLILLQAAEDWARSGFREGSSVSIGAGTTAPRRPLAKIVRAMLDGWTAACQAAVDSSTADPFDTLRPALDIRNYQGEITLRLRADGEIAEKLRDDDFRLRVSLMIENEGAAAAATLVAAPPDFLTGGDLHDRMIDILCEKQNLDHLFSDTGLPKAARARFEQFIRDAASDALVFRARKDGDRDSELLSFRGDWDDAERLAVVSAIFIVKHTASGLEVKLDVDGADPPLKLVFCDLSSSPPRPGKELPQYLLRLIAHLHNWQLALQ